MTRDVAGIVKTFVLEEFLPGEDPSLLEPSTPLISSGILDSIATVRLVSFLEDEFAIEFAAFEVSTENLDTLESIERFVADKLTG